MRKIIACLLTCCMICCGMIGTVYAAWEDQESSIEAAAVLDNGLQSVTSQSGDLIFKVQWPQNISCGQETDFMFSAEGGSGNYRYRIYALYVQEGDAWNPVYDVSYKDNGAFKSNSQFSFTFYASGTYRIRFSCMDMGSSPLKTLNSNYITLTIADDNYPSVDAIVSQAAKECEKQCTTDYDKTLWLHDWLITTGAYDSSYSYCSAEGVLARGKGTCESYTSAYGKLLNAVGIANGRAIGNGHCWSLVCLDGEWYQVDTTWDDPGYGTLEDFNSHLYFCITDKMMSQVHNEHTPDPEKACESLEDNYFIHSGEITKWSNAFVNDIKQALLEGKQNFTLSTDGTFPQFEYQNPPENYKNVMYPLTAYYLENKMEWTQNGQAVKLGVQYESDQLKFTVSALTCEKAVITFDVNGGQEMEGASMEVKLNGLYGELPVPMKEGYIFDGWYTALTGGERVTSQTVCEGSTTVYAHWSEDNSKKSGLYEEADGIWQLYDKGIVQTSYNGMYNDSKMGWLYVENGKVTLKKTDVISGTVNGIKGWWYVKDSKVQLGVSTVACNKYGWWAIRDGKVDFDYNGFLNNSSGWWYIENGKVTFEKTDIISGTVNGTKGWWYVKGSKVQLGVNTVAHNGNGWWAVRDGKVDFGYNGFADNANGWWYIENGKVTFEKTDIISGTVNGTKGWWYVKGSKVQLGTDTVAHNGNGWWAVRDGKVDFGYNGFADNANGWWYIENGKVIFEKTDVISGTVNAVNGWWYVKGGKVQLGVNTVAHNSSGWWAIRNGKVDFGYNGLASNEYGTWFIRNGKVDFSYTGYYQTGSGRVYIKNGKAA